MTDKILREQNKVQRHGFTVRFVHWTIALSTIMLIFSGFGQMPMYRRYGIAQLPGLGWSGDFAVTLPLHYIAAMFLLLGMTYHIVYHVMLKQYDIFPRKGDLKESYLIIKAIFTKGEEPPSDKYLAEQRLAYAFIGFSLMVVTVTGMVKVLKNLVEINFSGTIMLWATNLHTLSSFMVLLGVMAHLAAFVFKANRSLLPAIFTGKMNLEEARHRHSIWFNRMLEREKPHESFKAAPVKKENASV